MSDLSGFEPIDDGPAADQPVNVYTPPAGGQHVQQPSHGAPTAAHGPPAGSTVIYADRPGSRPLGAILAGLGWFVAVLLLVVVVMRGLPDGITPGPHVDPIDGSFALILYDDKQKPNYPEDVRQFIDSAGIADHMTQHATGWKKVDVDQLNELKNLDPIYAEMAGVVSDRSQPWLVVRSGRRIKAIPITDADAATKILTEYLR